ncbi:hypothetical protein DFH28DRAFT_880332, partial [Melampsora americana]
RVKESSKLPEFLLAEGPELEWHEHVCVTLRNRKTVEQGDFVKQLRIYVHLFQLTDSNAIGQVNAIWKAAGWSELKCVVLLQETQPGGISLWYGMREITRTHCKIWVDIKVRVSPVSFQTILIKFTLKVLQQTLFQKIHCILNVQHDCHHAACPVTDGAKVQVERRDTGKTVSKIAHVDMDYFILNSASHYSAETHREVASLGTREISPAKWLKTLRVGLGIWRSVPVNPRKQRQSKAKGEQKLQEEEEETGDEEGSEMILDEDWEVDDIM